MGCGQICIPIDILACLIRQKVILSFIEDDSMPYLIWHIIQLFKRYLPIGFDYTIKIKDSLLLYIHC